MRGDPNGTQLAIGPLMSKNELFRRVILATVSVSAIACGGGGTPPASDAGPIVVVDSGETPDAFSPPDAADDVCGEAPAVPGWPQLPATCLPRCTAATGHAINACSTSADPDSCIQAAIAADSTPGVRIRYASYILQVSCSGQAGVAYSCLEWQLYSCESEACPTEYNAYATCAGTGAACTTEQNALTTCAMNSAQFRACAPMRAGMCNAAQ